MLTPTPPTDAREGARVAAAAAHLASALAARELPRPRLMLVLGSGLGTAADDLEVQLSVPATAVPLLHPGATPGSTPGGPGGPGVPGHAGRLDFARLGGLPVLVQVGRVHLYEGASPADVVRPLRVGRALGVQWLLITNAAGGIRDDLVPGSFMGLSDQLNLTGADPLAAAEADVDGPAFTDLARLYDPDLAARLGAAAARAGLHLPTGVYAGRRGPSYETPAEIRMLRTLGADAVGMSTVLESIAGVAAGLAVAGLSCITNRAAGLSPEPLSHADVLAVGQRRAADLGALLADFAADLAGVGAPA